MLWRISETHRNILKSKKVSMDLYTVQDQLNQDQKQKKKE